MWFLPNTQCCTLHGFTSNQLSTCVFWVPDRCRCPGRYLISGSSVVVAPASVSFVLVSEVPSLSSTSKFPGSPSFLLGLLRTESGLGYHTWTFRVPAPSSFLKPRDLGTLRGIFLPRVGPGLPSTGLPHRHISGRVHLPHVSSSEDRVGPNSTLNLLSD